jgi:hypothetical protein
MIYRYTADSWHEFVSDLRARKINWTAGGSEARGNAEWSGCRSWDEALDYAVKGHPVARAAMESVAVKVTSAPEPLWDVAPVGAFPCIPAYAAGIPEDMFLATDDAPPVSQPIVRIAVNMSASAMIDAQEIINRGAALVTLIDRIQLSGRRVELIAIKHGYKNNDKFIWSVTVKRPEEPVDMDRVGLAFATPIMLRRFFFRVMEFMVPHCISDYGYSTHYAEECNEFHLTIPIISGGEYATPDRANRTVQQLWERAAIAA